MNRLAIFLAVLTQTFAYSASAESVYVKDRGNVSLDGFQCRDVSSARSSAIHRICYDSNHDYLIISFRGTNYQYCEIESDTVGELISAQSIEQYYNEDIKGDDDHDCRKGSVPE